jgi:hypothetical protein
MNHPRLRTRWQSMEIPLAPIQRSDPRFTGRITRKYRWGSRRSMQAQLVFLAKPALVAGRHRRLFLRRVYFYPLASRPVDFTVTLNVHMAWPASQKVSVLSLNASGFRVRDASPAADHGKVWTEAGLPRGESDARPISLRAFRRIGSRDLARLVRRSAADGLALRLLQPGEYPSSIDAATTQLVRQPVHLLRRLWDEDLRPAHGEMARSLPTSLSWLRQTGRGHLKRTAQERLQRRQMASFSAGRSPRMLMGQHGTVGLSSTSRPRSPLFLRASNRGEGEAFARRRAKIGVLRAALPERSFERPSALAGQHMSLLPRMRPQGRLRGGDARLGRRGPSMIWREPPEAAAGESADRDRQVINDAPIPTRKMPPTPGTTGVDPAIDLGRLTAQVYELIERKFRIERIRRGL